MSRPARNRGASREPTYVYVLGSASFGSRHKKKLTKKIQTESRITAIPAVT